MKNLFALLILTFVSLYEQTWAAGISLSPVTSGEWILEKRVAGDTYLLNNLPVYSADQKLAAIVEKKLVTVYQRAPSGSSLGAIKFQIPLDTTAQLTGAFVQFNRDSGLLCVSESFAVTIWDVPTGKKLFSHIERSRSYNYNDIRKCAFLPTNKHLLISSWSANSVLMNLADGKIISELPSTFSATADGTRIAVSEGNTTSTDIIDVLSGSIVFSIPGRKRVSWINDDRVIAAEGANSTAIYEAVKGNLFFQLPQSFYQVTIDSSGRRFAGITGRYHESVELYDIKTGAKLWSTGDDKTLYRSGLKFSRDGTQILSYFQASHGGSLKVLNGESKPVASVIVGRSNYEIHDYNFSEDGNQITVYATSKPAGVLKFVREFLYFKKQVN